MGEESSIVGLVGYIEVPGLQDGSEADLWKEITLNTGASQSTLQDIKFPETAGGYVYKDQSDHGSLLRNRFVHWRSHNSTLELVESSLDWELKGGLLRLQFQHSAVLGGLSIHETSHQLQILLATVSSVYRLTFPHPSRIPHTRDLRWTSSVFREASLSSLWDNQNSFVLNAMGSTVPLPHTAATGLNSHGDALFVLALNSGTLQVVSMPNNASGGKILTWEIRHTSVMSRIFSGLVPSAIRGTQEGDDMAISLALCSLQNNNNSSSSEPCVVALCKDLRIRLWSLNKRECLLSSSLMDHCKNEHSWNLSGQQPCLQLVPCSLSSGSLILAVHLCFPELSQFLLFRVEPEEGGNILLQHLASMAAPQHTLVDFKFTSTDMWTLWMDVNSDPMVLYAPYNSETGQMESSHWRSLSFLQTWPQEVSYTFVDAREAYLKEIFSPGRFSAATINKAINIYCHSSADISLRGTGYQKNIGQLKNRVTTAVENEIRTHACETELVEEAYLELQHNCWEKFLSYCIQYNEVGMKVLGLFADPETGFVGIIRKHSVSLCRPCDPLEVLLLSDVSHCTPSSFLEHAIAINDTSLIGPSNCKSLWSIMKSQQILNSYLTEDLQDQFDSALFYLRPPEDIASQIGNELIFSADGPLLEELEQELSQTTELLDCLHALLQQMDLSSFQEDMDLSQQTSEDQQYGESFFSSPSGVNAVHLSLLQIVMFRYYFCRDLAILEQIILFLAQRRKLDLSYELLEKLRSNVFSQTCCFTYSYFVMFWALQTQVTPTEQKTLETGLRELSLLDISDHSQKIWSSQSDKSETLAMLFIQEHGTSIGSRALHRIFESQSATPWAQAWHTYRTLLAASIWPISTSMIFPEFLLSSGQYLSLQEYVRLLQGWCERNSSSRLFLLANACLSLSQPLKALDLFSEAAQGIHKEPYLMERLVANTPAEATANYYLKVIQLFEYFNLPDCIIRLATKAIGCCTDKPSLATLWSLVFKYHLDLDRCEDAYFAMMNNPESTRRRDCLHQFLVVLFERGHQQQLLEFPFIGLQDDVILILESKARSTDLTSQSYYEFLYAFHVKCANYRRAASSMYEYSTRLGQEMLGLNGLSRQAACLLTTLNCLHLVDPNYAWIVKPVPTVHTNHEPVSMSPKRDYDGEEIEKTDKWRQLQVLEMKDITREYELVHCRMRLLKESADHMAGPLSPTDTLTLLVAEDLFPLAVKLCQVYDMSLQPVFEGMAARCVTGLVLNNREISKDQLWKLLEQYLSEHEAAGQSKYHRLISEKLLSSGHYLPTWLLRSYKSRNSPELLLLFMSNDFSNEASDLAVEIIDNALFQGKQISDPKKISLWLPYTLLDTLLAKLEENASNFLYKQMHSAVAGKLNDYFQTLQSWASC